MNGYEVVVRLLLATGQVEANSRDTAGWTPLIYAAINGYEAVVRLLLSYCDGLNLTHAVWVARKYLFPT